MSHLLPDDLVDAIGEEVTPRVAAHLAECESCRRHVQALRTTLATVKDADVPEPPSSFWPRFAARVGDATSAGPVRATWWPATAVGVTWTRALAAAALSVLVASAAVLWNTSAPVKPPEMAPSTAMMSEAIPDTPEPIVPGEESAWELLADASTGIDWDAVSDAGLALAPGAADGAVMQLSDAERSELVRLLKVELDGSL